MSLDAENPLSPIFNKLNIQNQNVYLKSWVSWTITLAAVLTLSLLLCIIATTGYGLDAATFSYMVYRANCSFIALFMTPHSIFGLSRRITLVIKLLFTFIASDFLWKFLTCRELQHHIGAGLAIDSIYLILGLITAVLLVTLHGEENDREPEGDVKHIRAALQKLVPKLGVGSYQARIGNRRRKKKKSGEKSDVE